MGKQSLQLSAKMALAMGVFLPLVETVRRFKQLLDFSEFFSWFDDYVLGGVLIWTGYKVLKRKEKSGLNLVAGWGFATGALFLSLLGQFTYMLNDTPDPGIFSTQLVALAKVLIFGYMLFGLKKVLSGVNN